MRIGLALPHTGTLASPTLVRDFAQAADELGYASLWAVDHLAIPHHIESAYTLGAEARTLPDGTVTAWMGANYEQLSTLLFVAGVTSRARLGTSVSVLPLRNPVVHARMLATLDVYSGGRLVCGVGAGWLAEEAQAVGMPWDRRGARTDEHIALLRALWTATGDSVSFDGRFHSLPPIHPDPRPLQKPCPPIWVGGHGAAALERAGRLGDGWIAGPISVSRAAPLIDSVREATRRAGRDPEALTICLATSFAIQADPERRVHRLVVADGGVSIDDVDTLTERLRAYRDLGTDELRISIAASTGESLLRALRTIATEILPGIR